MHVAQINQWSWVREFSLFKEISNSDWIIVGCFFDDSLNFFEVSKSGTALDIFEIDLLVISVGEDLAQEEKETLIGAILLKDCNDSLGINL